MSAAHPDRPLPSIDRARIELRGIGIRQLLYFQAVAEELHFGRAAERLHVSQPPLSMQIRALEERLGARLFERARSGVTLTAAGAVLHDECAALLPRLLEAVARVRAVASGDAGALRIGFVTPAEYGFLPECIRGFRDNAPQVALSLREMTSDAQFEALAEGGLDAGFVLPPVPAADLAYRSVFREPLVAALPATDPRAAASGPIRARALRDLPLVIFPRDKAPALYDEVLAFFAAAGIAPVIGQAAILMPTIVSLVAAGLGMALVPASLRKSARQGVVFRPLHGRAPAIEIGLAWRAGNADPALARFLAHAERTLGMRAAD